jgi:hypothetical protein
VGNVLCVRTSVIEIGVQTISALPVLPLTTSTGCEESLSLALAITKPLEFQDEAPC